MGGVVIITMLVTGLIAYSFGKWREGFRRRSRFSKHYGSSWVNFQKYQVRLVFNILGWSILALMVLAAIAAG